MKIFKQFTYLYCILLYTIGLIYVIEENIAFHYHKDFFEGYRLAVPILLFLFFHIPVVLFFIIVKNTSKWAILLATMGLLYLCFFVGFQLALFIGLITIIAALVYHCFDFLRLIKDSNTEVN